MALQSKNTVINDKKNKPRASFIITFLRDQSEIKLEEERMRIINYMLNKKLPTLTGFCTPPCGLDKKYRYLPPLPPPFINEIPQLLVVHG